MWPHKGTDTKALSQALWAVPRTRNLNQGVCVPRKRSSNSQKGRKTYLPCSPQTHKTQSTGSYQKHISEWPQCTYGSEGIPWSLTEVEVPMLLHGMVVLLLVILECSCCWMAWLYVCGGVGWGKGGCNYMYLLCCPLTTTMPN